ncbi:hypothetical protein BSY239_963 [Hydrogenophaga sp. RAC07]|uniref:hypothetical protein n=1 Tax=Hydrogenophaga sp. RAC07 TaxID=1842537 RepID=UPI000857FAD9|nr:hypothetical protein [Hydrogenophaga sp. RAC07]AOF88181.1 hypothetical protein BSY239_963 [Hydrogenophaga sp. RAC07]
MAQLSYPVKQSTHTAVAIRPDTSGIVRALLRVWVWACRHAERPGRVVPYV